MIKQEEKVPTIVWKYNLLKQAIEKWGSGPQLDMAVEEAAELIVAIQHLKRGRVTWDVVAEEIADCKIVLAQIELIANLGSVVDAKEMEKLKRLEERLK